MAPVNCCCSSSWWRRKVKGGKKCVTQPSASASAESGQTLKVEHRQKSSESNNSRSSVPLRLVGNKRCKVKVTNHDSSPVAADREELNHEKENELQKMPIMKGNSSDCRLPVHNMDDHENVIDKSHCTNTEEDLGMIVSDRSGWKAEFLAAPEQKCSCSNLAITSVSRELNDELPSLTSSSLEEKKRSTEIYAQRPPVGDMSPVSVRTRCSADNVILKKHSSSQALPSGSQKLWWKLFLWSHRNLHKIEQAKPQPISVEPSALDQQGGYSSDSIEPRQAVNPIKLRSSSLLARESMETDKDDRDNHSWDGFYGGSNVWPHNQWVAFPMSTSPLARVSEWIEETSKHSPYQGDEDDHTVGGGFLAPISPKNDTLLVKDSFHSTTQQPEEVSHANRAIQSLNANSAVAHITGIGLKVIPVISHFVSLKAVHLSGNFIAHISPGSLPKGLHILNLSKNKISTIEGLRELTRLRTLNLSYNRISSIGQGLSSCTLIKELCLAGNKISNVEGLHRLLKLAALDLSFNKITSVSVLGQLVANYSSLTAVNLLGNPIQSNMSDDQLKKMVQSLLPKLALLNRQPINPKKAREIRAVGNSSSSSSRGMRRKATRRAVNVRSSTSSPHAGQQKQPCRAVSSYDETKVENSVLPWHYALKGKS